MRVAVVGAGNVGGALALEIALDGLADVTLIDVAKGLAEGKALDITEAGPILNVSVKVEGSSDPGALRGADIVVVTAGRSRTPGMSRDDLAQNNARVIRSVADDIAQHAPEAIVIMVTNPVDVMSYLAWKVTGFARERVMGMGGTLDSSRFRSFLALELGVPANQISAMVLGGHGDLMVVLSRYTMVAGVPIAEFLPPDRLRKLVERTQKAGGEIVSLLKTGSAYVAPAAGILELLRAITADEKRVLPVSTWAGEKYGLGDVFVGLPARVGRRGVEEVVELALSVAELEALEASARQVQEMTKVVS